jgi:Spy/CpxP family protein refolding chaperone
MRLPSSREWFFVMQTGNGLRDTRRKPLPMPVINYEEDKYGLLCEQHPTKLIHEKEDDMKRTLLKNLPALTAVCLAFSLIWVQIGGAVQKHQQPGNEKSKPAAGESSSLGMMPGSGGEPEMMGMMGGPGDEGGQDMMGPGMMRMMMSHMMGGPGGMGKMMGKMGRGMKGRGGMAHMARMLEELNLTPEQWDQVRTLARERLEKMADLWAQRMKLQIELAALRWDTEIDPQKVKDLFVKKAEAKAEMFLAGLAYMRELKKIITAEQLKKLESQGF